MLAAVSATTITLPDLTVPRTGIATARAVVNGYLRETIRAFATLPSGFLSPPTRSLYQQTLAAVQPILKSDPRPLAAVLRRPTLAGLLFAAVKELYPQGDRKRADAWITELCLLVHLEMAAQGTPLPADLQRPGT